MASVEEKKKPQGVIAIDIEKVGKRSVAEDPIFAIGFATCAITETDFNNVTTFSVARNLQKHKEISWQDFWIREKYEWRCWDEFWSKNEATIEKLQSSKTINLVTGRREFVEQINAILKACEEMYSSAVILTDTTAFDTVFTSSELVKFGYEPLNFTRDGMYRWAGCIELDSFISGVFGVTDGDEWKVLEAKVKEHIEPLFAGLVEHDHHPENDAKFILLKFLAARQYAKSLHTQ